MLLEVVLGPVQVVVLLHVIKRVGVLLDEGVEAICVRVGEDVRQAEGDHGAMRRPAQPARVLEASLCEHALEQGGVVGGVEEGLVGVEIEVLLVALLALALKFDEGRGEGGTRGA